MNPNPQRNSCDKPEERMRRGEVWEGEDDGVLWESSSEDEHEEGAARGAARTTVNDFLANQSDSDDSEDTRERKRRNRAESKRRARAAREGGEGGGGGGEASGGGDGRGDGGLEPRDLSRESTAPVSAPAPGGGEGDACSEGGCSVD